MVKDSERPIAAVLELALAMLWIGVLAGVSFLATPAKFLAPSLTLPVALDVGRHTFAIFNKVEWLLAALLIVALSLRPRSGIAFVAGALATLFVVVEAAWLLPTLDQRVGLIIAGQPPPPSHLHNVYIGLEAAKLLLLVVVALMTALRIVEKRG